MIRQFEYSQFTLHISISMLQYTESSICAFSADSHDFNHKPPHCSTTFTSQSDYSERGEILWSLRKFPVQSKLNFNFAYFSSSLVNWSVECAVLTGLYVHTAVLVLVSALEKREYSEILEKLMRIWCKMLIWAFTEMTQPESQPAPIKFKRNIYRKKMKTNSMLARLSGQGWQFTA